MGTAPFAARPCNACGAPSPQGLFERDGFHIVRCGSCGLVYVGEDPATIDFEALYDESYYTGGQGGAGVSVACAASGASGASAASVPSGAASQVFDDYLGQEAARRASARRRLWSLRRLQPRGRLLDVGCAAGFFLAEARAAYEVQGVELSAYSSAHARERLGLDVFTGTLHEAALPSARFDLVTLWDVIEHVPDPAAVLAEVARVLAPGGRVVLTTGDIGSAYAQARGAQWHLMTPPWHLYFFSRATLGRLAARAGLRVQGVAARGVAGDSALARSRPGIVLGHLLGRGDIMQVTLGHGA